MDLNVIRPAAERLIAAQADQVATHTQFLQSVDRLLERTRQEMLRLVANLLGVSDVDSGIARQRAEKE